MASLTQVTNTKTGMCRYYIDGKRVSRGDYEMFIIRKEMEGKTLNCFSTKAKNLGDGHVKRWNYSCI